MDKNKPCDILTEQLGYNTKQLFDFYNHVVGILIKKGIDFNINFNYNLGYISLITYMQKEELKNEPESDN